MNQKNIATSNILSSIEKPLKPEIKACDICGEILDWNWFSGNIEFNRKPEWRLNSCEICSENSSKKIAEENKEYEQKANNERIEKLFEQSKVRERFKDKTFENYIVENVNQKIVVDECKNFASDFDFHFKNGTWLLLCGNSGTGKGHLCAAIIRELVQQKHTCFFTKMLRMLRSVKDTWRSDSYKTESDLISFFETIDLLIVDEIGVQFATKTEQQIIYDIFDGRYELMKPLILTSNESFKSLEKILGHRIIDRFFEGNNKILDFKWTSYRRKIKA